MTKKLFAVSCQKTDGKERTDGKDIVCHQCVICRPLANGKDTPGRRQKETRRAPLHRGRHVCRQLHLCHLPRPLCHPPFPLCHLLAHDKGDAHLTVTASAPSSSVPKKNLSLSPHSPPLSLSPPPTGPSPRSPPSPPTWLCLSPLPAPPAHQHHSAGRPLPAAPPLPAPPTTAPLPPRGSPPPCAPLPAAPPSAPPTTAPGLLVIPPVSRLHLAAGERRCRHHSPLSPSHAVVPAGFVFVRCSLSPDPPASCRAADRIPWHRPGPPPPQITSGTLQIGSYMISSEETVSSTDVAAPRTPLCSSLASSRNCPISDGKISKMMNTSLWKYA